MDVSIIIPVYNEAENIGPLIAEIRGIMKGRMAYEIICVDDGSTDRTGSVLKEIQKDFSRLRVIRHRNRCGQSTALRTGVKAAKAPWIATLDGDGQNDPSDILKLFEVLKEHDTAQRVQLVTGIRRRRRDSFVKRVSSRIANAIRCRLLHDNIEDTGCGLKLMDRDAFLALPFFEHMHRFLPALIIRDGGRVVPVDVNHRPRTGGRSKYGTLDRLWAGIIDLLGVMWLQRRMRVPLIEEGNSDEVR